MAATDCNFHIFPTATTVYSDCDRAKDFLTKSGLSFEALPAVPGQTVVTKIGDVELQGWDEAKYKEALASKGYPTAADPNAINYPMALLALAERNGSARWACHWPLLFLPFAAFVAYRDLAEGGLEDNIRFLALLRDPEIAQHLFFYALMASFGLFEWNVRTGRLRSPGAALVFPLLTATAAGALLTHSHSLANVKDLLLIEVTHVPLALLGITFAWARWLEVRLVPAEGAIAGWAWRTSFVVVGLLLVLYREI